MQIQNVNSTNFNGVNVNVSKMSAGQQHLCSALVDSMTYSDTFIKAHEGLLDVYLLAGDKNSVNVTIMDKISDMFVKNGKKILGLNVKNNDNMTTCSETILSYLENVLNKKVARPAYNHNKIVSGETDFAKLRPDVHQDMVEATQGVVGVDVIKKIDDSYRNLINEF